MVTEKLNIFPPDFDNLAARLIRWYQSQQRPLPWRKTYNPYHIWISEIMLQQTQMERGVAYFNRWIARFPDTEAVAQADEQEILRYWQGLGYYARARNIHRAAKKIATHFSGIVPDDYQTLLSLPGIGPYTAAAIASIAGNHDIAVVDTNVCRIYARLFDLDIPVKSGRGLALVKELAKTILPPGTARHYNQAIMDFGGLICTPRNPQCKRCLLKDNCGAFQNNVVGQRPLLPKKKEVFFERKLVGLICCNGRFLICQRKENKLWAGLWDLPGIVVVSQKGKELGDVPLQDEDKVKKLLSAVAARELVVDRYLVSVKHQFTNHVRTVNCWLCLTSNASLSENERWVSLKDVAAYGVPSGTKKILKWLHSSFGEKTLC